MEIEKIKSILDAIKDTDIEEIWFETGGEKSGFRRKDFSSLSSDAPAKTAGETIKHTVKEPVPPVTVSQNQIKSTMVGTFLRSSKPGGKPLVEEGDFISVGQKVCIVEAMKVMKEITASVAGKIEKILVADNHPVEYGQPLFEISPAPAVNAAKKE